MRAVVFASAESYGFLCYLHEVHLSEGLVLRGLVLGSVPGPGWGDTEHGSIYIGLYSLYIDVYRMVCTNYKVSLRHQCTLKTMGHRVEPGPPL